MKQTRRPSEDGRGLLWADTSWWDDRVLPVLSYTLIIKPCLGGILSKRLMRGRQTENKSDLAEVKGRAPHSHGMYWWKLCEGVWCTESIHMSVVLKRWLHKKVVWYVKRGQIVTTKEFYYISLCLIFSESDEMMMCSLCGWKFHL